MSFFWKNRRHKDQAEMPELKPPYCTSRWLSNQGSDFSAHNKTSKDHTKMTLQWPKYSRSQAVGRNQPCNLSDPEFQPLRKTHQQGKSPLLLSVSNWPHLTIELLKMTLQPSRQRFYLARFRSKRAKISSMHHLWTWRWPSQLPRLTCLTNLLLWITTTRAHHSNRSSVV